MGEGQVVKLTKINLGIESVRPSSQASLNLSCLTINKGTHHIIAQFTKISYRQLKK